MKRAILLTMLALAGCAKAPDWQKPGASRDAVAADMQACRLSAPYEPGVRAPPTRLGKGGGLDAMVEREGDRMMKDENHVAECMRAKGYVDAAR